MRDPDITGTAGRAWLAPLTEEIKARWPAGLPIWLLHCPGAHPIWAWYVVSACSLRDVPGLSPAKILVAGATHEIQVIALHPDYQPDNTWCTNGTGRWASHFMTPANLVEQLAGLDDEKMNELARLLVLAFCRGLLSPDTDDRSATVDALRETAEHLRAGKHPPS